MAQKVHWLVSWYEWEFFSPRACFACRALNDGGMNAVWSQSSNFQTNLRRCGLPIRLQAPARAYFRPVILILRTSTVHKLHTPSPPEIRRPPLQESTHRAQIAFVAEKIRLFGAFAPELDGEGKGVDGLLVAADEGPTEVDALEIVLFGLQVGDLADVITVIGSAGGFYFVPG